MWDFVNGKRRLYKTMKAAQEDCEKHQRLWMKACEATGIRALQEIFSKLPLGIPLWAKKKINRKAYALLTENQPHKARRRECDMAMARARQTDNKVSMEAATSLGGRRKALAARRSKTELAALRENSASPRPSQRPPDQGQDRRPH